LKFPQGNPKVAIVITNPRVKSYGENVHGMKEVLPRGTLSSPAFSFSLLTWVIIPFITPFI